MHISSGSVAEGEQPDNCGSILLEMGTFKSSSPLKVIICNPLAAEAYENLEAHGDKIFRLVEFPDKEDKPYRDESEASRGGEIQFFYLTTLRTETLLGDAKAFTLSRDGHWLTYVSSDRKIRVLKAGEKPEDNDHSYRAGGSVDEERGSRG